LKEYNPQLVKRYFDESKITWHSFSENEVIGKIEYEKSRSDLVLWNMLEKGRRARNAEMARNIKRLKNL